MPQGRKPEYRAVIKTAPKIWHQVGAGWKTQDGEGISVKLFSFPQDGSFVLMPNDKKED